MTIVKPSLAKAPILIIDVEATCDDRQRIAVDEMEIIEIGAVWTLQDGAILDSFESFVRPIRHPVLTSFCTALIGIQQEKVDQAELFPAVMSSFEKFIGSHQHEGGVWASWGNYDRKQIDQDCKLHNISNPLTPFEHLNLKQRFASARHIKQVGMAKALEIVGLTLQGQHHRALSDARNISRLLIWINVETNKHG